MNENGRTRATEQIEIKSTHEYDDDKFPDGYYENTLSFFWNRPKFNDLEKDGFQNELSIYMDFGSPYMKFYFDENKLFPASRGNTLKSEPEIRDNTCLMDIDDPDEIRELAKWLNRIADNIEKTSE